MSDKERVTFASLSRPLGMRLILFFAVFGVLALPRLAAATKTRVQYAVLCSVREYKLRQEHRQSLPLQPLFFVESYRPPADNEVLASEMSKHKDVVRFEYDSSSPLFLRAMRWLAEQKDVPDVVVFLACNGPRPRKTFARRLAEEIGDGSRLVYGGPRASYRGQRYHSREFSVISHALLSSIVTELNGTVQWTDELEVAVGRILTSRKDVSTFQINP